jgi:hypothetical protein
MVCSNGLNNIIYVGECRLKNNRICNYDGCNKNCNFNFKNAKKAIFCLTHRLNGMVDVRHARCIHPKCEKISMTKKLQFIAQNTSQKR